MNYSVTEFEQRSSSQARAALHKTFTENWDSKAQSVGTILAYLETNVVGMSIEKLFDM